MKAFKTLAAIFASAFLTTVSFARDNLQIVSSIDSIVKTSLPAGTDISIYIWDLDGDSAVYAHREDVLNRPASTMKVLTSFNALKSLGLNYSFQTQLKTDGTIDGDSILNGNLYLIGGLDPELTEDDLKALVGELANCGIRQINGDVIADISIMDSIYWGSGWAWDDTPSSFQPYISPLTVHGGYVEVSVRPGRKGEAPSVKVTPESRYYTIENHARTGIEPLGPLSVKREWLYNRNVIRITGNASKATTIEQNLYDSDDFTFALFREYLTDAGISFYSYRNGVCPADSKLIAMTGHTLQEVMRETLKESINLNAEAMFLQAARSKSRARISFSDAAKYEDRLLKQYFPECQGYNIADGSGLSMYDYVPARLFVNVLRQIYRNPEYYALFYDCLPISGRDGTLKNRLNNWATIDRIHAKTGTVTGSCTLAGYAVSNDHRNFAFCIMNSAAIKMAPSRRVQDAILTELCR